MYELFQEVVGRGFFLLFFLVFHTKSWSVGRGKLFKTFFLFKNIFGRANLGRFVGKTF